MRTLQPTNYQPVIIIGAPRSGTNILRDVICRVPGVETWPCDEINYIWRHGNASYPSDAFPPELATEPIKSYIRGQFNKLHKRGAAISHIVEKTCANSLRVGFVNQVIPDAKFIYIVRNGLDVVASAKKRWKSELDLKYILRKARYVPLSDLPYYAARYFWNRIHKLFAHEKRLAYWGPRLNGIDSYPNQTLAETCAVQWRECVNSAERDLSKVPSTRVHVLNYESFVNNPGLELMKIARFLNIAMSQEESELFTTDVVKDSIGKSGKDLTAEDIERIMPIMEDALKKHGYFD